MAAALTAVPASTATIATTIAFDVLARIGCHSSPFAAQAAGHKLPGPLLRPTGLRTTHAMWRPGNWWRGQQWCQPGGEQWQMPWRQPCQWWTI
eukprot:11176803-Lingulodinium_polyedra.AAC.1